MHSEKSLLGILERGLLLFPSLLNLASRHMITRILGSPNCPVSVNTYGLDMKYEEKVIKNKSREAMLSLLGYQTKVQTRNFSRSMLNDQLALQTIGTLAMLITKRKNISRAFLYQEKIFPFGLSNVSWGDTEEEEEG